jgi:hypothetical protein
MNFSRSSMGLHAFQGILHSPQKAPLCNPCPRNELSPLSQEGHAELGTPKHIAFAFDAATSVRRSKLLEPMMVGVAAAIVA